MLILRRTRGKYVSMLHAGDAGAPAIDMPYRVAIKPIEFFIASESVDCTDVQRLAQKIEDAGMWTAPIPVDADTGIIMDGNHRASAAVRLQLSHVPCILLSYRDPRVTVTHWRTGESYCVERIYRAILGDRQLLPYKSTRHLFAPRLPETEIQLGVLRHEQAPRLR